MTNYIVDTNAFHLAGPPVWWLRQLHDFDNSLVVVPSRQTCVYRLAQRRPLNLPEHLVNDALFQESDTKMLASYGLVPVTTILPTANWSNPYLFEELRRRAPHRMGGAEKVNALLDAQDAKESMDRQLKNDAMLTDLSKDAWGFYRQKLGVRSHMYIPPTRPSTPSPSPRAPHIRIIK